MDEDEAPEMTDEETIRVCIEQVAMLEDDIRRRDELIAALRVGAEAIRDQGYRAGIEAAANEAWNVIAAHATDSIPLALADEVRDYIRALSQPREPTPSPAAAPTIHSDACVGRVHDSLGCSCGAPREDAYVASDLTCEHGVRRGPCPRCQREDAPSPVRSWAERVADVEARAERALCPACAGLGVCAGCDGTGRDERDAT